MISALFAMFFQAVAGDPAVPPATPPAAPAAESPAAAPKDPQQAQLDDMRARQKLVCRNEVTLGSRLPTRVCRSAAEEVAATDDSRAWIDRAQSQMATKGN